MSENIDKNTAKRLVKWFKKNKIFITDDPEELVKVEYLDLKMKELNKIPIEFAMMTGLKELDLSYNKLSSLPPQFGALCNLKVLKLERNELTYLPTAIFNLPALTHLKLESNLISLIQPEIGNLKSLQELDLYYNKLNEIPEEIGDLTNLVILNLSANNLSSLPDSFANLVNLEELNIWSNNIKDIQDSIKNLPKLKDLHITLNPIKLNKKLIEAVIKDNTKLATQLISHGADANYKWEGYNNLEFTTALFEAKSLEMVKLLIENDADPQIKRTITKPVASIKVWEKDTSEVEYESFLSKKHPLPITKYLKSKKLIGK